AGLDAIRSVDRRVQIVFPVSASTATVFPRSRLTNRRPAQKAGGNSIRSPIPRAHVLRLGTPSLMSGRDRSRSGLPPNSRQHGSSAGRGFGGFGGGFGGGFTGVVSLVTTVTPVGATSPPSGGVRRA